MFLGVFLPLCASWVDQALAIAGQIAFNDLGASYSSQFLSALESSGDTFSRAAQAVAWSRYVERPPFNLPAFRHWHFRPNPFNQTLHPVTPRFDDDDLSTILAGSKSQLTLMLNGQVTRLWPFSFAAKIVLGAIADSFAPLHNTELFSVEFPDGDRNGRDFIVQLNGRSTSLFEAWESGCGAFSDRLTFSAADWAGIEELAVSIAAEFPRDTSAYRPSDVLAASHKFDTEVVYKGLKNSSRLTSSYVANCAAWTKRSIGMAGCAMSSVFQNVKIPKPAAKRANRAAGGSKRELLAWALIGAVAPLVMHRLWHRAR
jgi:hypothetical protein